jgi:hypothetical protein
MVLMIQNQKDKSGENNMPEINYHNPSCEVKQNEDSMPEVLGGEYTLRCLRAEGNTKLPVLRLGFIKNQVTSRKDENNAKLPMSSNKDTSENIQVAEEWRNLDGEKRRICSLSIRSLFVARQLEVSPIGAIILNSGGSFFSSQP